MSSKTRVEIDMLVDEWTDIQNVFFQAKFHDKAKLPDFLDKACPEKLGMINTYYKRLGVLFTVVH